MSTTAAAAAAKEVSSSSAPSNRDHRDKGGSKLPLRPEALRLNNPGDDPVWRPF